jgi:hypothetical protein
MVAPAQNLIVLVKGFRPIMFDVGAVFNPIGPSQFRYKFN